MDLTFARRVSCVGIPALSVVNSVGSLIARTTKLGVYLNAGRESSVASTKAFTTQVRASNSTRWSLTGLALVLTNLGGQKVASPSAWLRLTLDGPVSCVLPGDGDGAADGVVPSGA